MTQHKLPGASLAIAYKGRLVYHRGFGLADRDKQDPVEPRSLFRIGSIAKPLTAVALLRLQEQGKIKLDDKVFDILSGYQEILGDPRMRRITVRQLLQHTGGWDAELSGEPLAPSHEEIGEAGASFPPDHDEVMQVWLRRPLDFEPGQSQSYSNFGYLLAGRVIERVTGKRYDSAVRELVLKPQGVTRMKIGGSLACEAADGEVRYYDEAGRQAFSIFSEAPVLVPLPYGAFSTELADSAGGWIASTADLLRVMTAIDGSRTRILSAESMEQLVRRPAFQPTGDVWYGLGILVASAGPVRVLLHNGGAPGTYGLVVSMNGEWSFAFLTNTDPGGEDPGGFEDALIQSMATGLGQLTAWPGHDLFQELYPGK